MKKYIWLLGILIAFCFPVKVDAVLVLYADMYVVEQLEPGQEFSLDVRVYFDELENARKGLMLVNYEFNYDPSVFQIVSVASDQWDSEVSFLEGKYYVNSLLKMVYGGEGKCSNGILVCYHYSLHMRLLANPDTKATSSNIEIQNITYGGLQILSDISNYTEEYIENNLFVSGSSVRASKTFSITQSSPSLVRPPISNEGIVPTIDTPAASSVRTPLLKSLQVENYDLVFYVNKNKYDLVVDKEVNSLTVLVQPDFSSYRYEVIGSDDLKAHGYQVLVDVYSDDGGKNTYTISVKSKREKQIVNNGKVEKKVFMLNRSI